MYPAGRSGSATLLGYDLQGAKVYPDLAFALPVPRAESTVAVRQPDQLVIAINPMAVHAKGYWYKEDADKYAAYVDKLAAYVQGLAAAGQPFILIANQPRDERVIRDVMDSAAGLGVSSAILERSFRQSYTVAEYMGVLAEVDLVVATADRLAIAPDDAAARALLAAALRHAGDPHARRGVGGHGGGARQQQGQEQGSDQCGHECRLRLVSVPVGSKAGSAAIFSVISTLLGSRAGG